MTTSNNSATAEKKEIVAIKRTFDLPVTSIWKAFSNPESFKKWWGPEGYTCPDATIDFKVGGKLFASMQGEDGKKIWSTGTYKEIIALKKIVVSDNFADSSGNIVSASDYNMPGEWAEGLVTIELKDGEGKTELRLHHEGLPAEMIDECTKGWQSSFNKLERSMK